MKISFMCNFNYIICLMSHITCLNNTYKLSYSWLKEIFSNWFGAKLCPSGDLPDMPKSISH